RRTAVWPRPGRKLGITRRQSSYGVLISVEPSTAMTVLRAGTTSPPYHARTNANVLVRAVTTSVTSANRPSTLGGRGGKFVASSTSPRCHNRPDTLAVVVSTVSGRQCCPASTSTAVALVPANRT